MEAIKEYFMKANKKSYKKWIGIALVLVLLLSTVGLGPISINLYSSQVDNGSVGTNLGGGLDFDKYRYEINHYYKKDKVGSFHFENGTETPKAMDMNIVFKAVTEEPKYSGNYFLPFYKTYKVDYVSNMVFDQEKTTIKYNTDFKTKIEGTLTIKVIGLCTFGEAKKIAEKAIIASVNKYNSDQMGREMNK